MTSPFKKLQKDLRAATAVVDAGSTEAFPMTQPCDIVTCKRRKVREAPPLFGLM